MSSWGSPKRFQCSDDNYCASTVVRVCQVTSPFAELPRDFRPYNVLTS